MKTTVYYVNSPHHRIPDAAAWSFRIGRLELCAGWYRGPNPRSHVTVNGRLHPGCTGTTLQVWRLMIGFRWHCNAHHYCHCGTSSHRGGHHVGESGCQRRMVGAPELVSIGETKHECRWIAEGQEITGYTLWIQWGYKQHVCGCWSRS